MRRLLSALVVALVLWAQPAAASLLGVVKGATSGGVVTSAAMNTAGATIIGCVVAAQTSTAATQMTDTATNTWLTPYGTLGITGGSGGSLNFFYVLAPSTNASHTFSYTGGFSSLVCMAFDDTITGIDTSTGPTAATQAGSITPASGTDLFFSGTGAGVSTTTMSVNSSFTSGAGYVNLDLVPNYDSAAGWKLSSSAENPTWTCDAIGGTLLVAFATSGGPPPPSGGRSPCSLRLLGVGCDVP